MGKKKPTNPPNGASAKPPTPPPFARLTTPGKWVAPMAAAPPAFRREKVEVQRTGKTPAPAQRPPTPTPPAPEAPVAKQPEPRPQAKPVEPPAPPPQPELTPDVVQESEPVFEEVEIPSPSAHDEVIDVPVTAPAPRTVGRAAPEFIDTHAKPAPQEPKLPRYPVMGRTRQVVYLIAALVLIGLSVWISGLWIHGLTVVDRALYETRGGTYHWSESYNGAVYFHAEQDPTGAHLSEPVWRVEMGDRWAHVDPPPAIEGASTHGITRAAVVLPNGRTAVPYLVISYWLLVIVTLVPGALLGWRFFQLHRRCKMFRCPHCHSSLRFSPLRCPSCGMTGPLAAGSYTDLASA